MTDLDVIANAFVSARRDARALPGYPGEIPQRLEQSYAIQDRAIGLWDQPVAGWKIGRLTSDKQAEHGTERLAGPIFAPAVQHYDGQPVEVPVFTGGFAAVEAEYVFRVGHDADPARTDYSPEEALHLIDVLYCGIEMAGSPLATINALGPTVVASDFGNNHGLIVGPRLMTFGADASPDLLGPDAVAALTAETEIDGATVGTGGLFTMPGGPLNAIAWLAGHLAARGRPLRRGQYVSSGATTGIHDIKSGQTAQVRFTAPDGHVLRLAALAAAAERDKNVMPAKKPVS